MKYIITIFILLFTIILYSQKDSKNIVVTGRVYDLKFKEFLDSYEIKVHASSIKSSNSKDDVIQKLTIDSCKYFKVQLKNDQDYLIEACSGGYNPGFEVFSKTDLEKDTVIDIIIMVISSMDDFLCMKKPVLEYEKNSYLLDSANIDALNFTTEQMFADPRRTIRLDVYCKEIGYYEVRRAEDARNYIVNNGVEKKRNDISFITEKQSVDIIKIVNTGYNYNIKKPSPSGKK